MVDGRCFCRVALVLLSGWCGACDFSASDTVTPQRGLQTGGSKVELTGRGFAVDGPPVVYVGRRAAKGVVVHGDQRLTFVAPQTTEPRVVDVVLRFRGGRERVFPGAFEYLEAKGAVLQPSLSK